MKPSKKFIEARKNKNDEFYTMLPDIENELDNYKEHLKNKVIICPCDNWKESNFYNYFKNNFDKLKIKKVIFSGLNAEIRIIEPDKEYSLPMESNGDFRHDEVITLIKEADIVITNPPFSLFRIFVELMVELNKQFIIIGVQVALTYKNFFPLVKKNKVFIGYTEPKKFIDKRNNDKIISMGFCLWYSTFATNKQNPFIETGMTLEEGLLKGLIQHYDNFDAYNVDKAKYIPMDYNGIIGVPLSFLKKINPKQFQVIGLLNAFAATDEANGIYTGSIAQYYKPNNLLCNRTGPVIDKKAKFARLLIRNIKLN